jgi:hypothetical protein
MKYLRDNFYVENEGNIKSEYIKLPRYSFNAIYIIEDRNFWKPYADICSKEDDLVLCIDFGLKKQLEEEGYTVAYLNHIVHPDMLGKLNWEMHGFLNNWYKDDQGKDILEYEGFNIGDTLLLNILNDVTNFCHFFFSGCAVRCLQFNQIHIGASNSIAGILEKAGLVFNSRSSIGNRQLPSYYFPISRWMDEKVNLVSWKMRCKGIVARGFDYVFLLTDLLFGKKKVTFFIQNHFNTQAVISQLNNNKDVKLILGNYSGIRNILNERRVFYKKYPSREGSILIRKFRQSKKSKWQFEEYIISDFLYELITPIIEVNIDAAISKIKSIRSYFKRNPIQVMVPITNLWMDNRLLMQYCFMQKVPVFMILNGLMTLPFWNDARDSDWVNCFGMAMKEDYFKNAANALPLGDPRMDIYASAPIKEIDRKVPTIVIGSAGFNLLDLNSYLAVEFDFLNEIYSALSYLCEEGFPFKLIIKARSNAYKILYEQMLSEFFPTMQTDIEQDASFHEIIQRADLYITFYSQTVFEASCLGIPVIYYKNDTQEVNRPFNGCTELVTARTINELKEKIRLFYADSDIFTPFLQREVMEEYVGPLDGLSTKRNIDFMFSLVKNSSC